MENLTIHKWKVLAGAICVLVVGLLLFVLWPIASGGFHTFNQISELQSRIDRGSTWQETTTEIERERGEIESFFLQVASDTPTGEGMSQTLETLFRIAEETAASIQQIKPLDPLLRDTYRENPIEIRFTGSYHNAAHLVNKIEHLGYWIEPKSIQLHPEQTEQSNLEVILILSVYHMNLPADN
ncbi:hypothetical protein BH23BAC3_BH23BAC3_22400 [soil metagenome]